MWRTFQISEIFWKAGQKLSNFQKGWRWREGRFYGIVTWKKCAKPKKIQDTDKNPKLYANPSSWKPSKIPPFPDFLQSWGKLASYPEKRGSHFLGFMAIDIYYGPSQHELSKLVWHVPFFETKTCPFGNSTCSKLRLVNTLSLESMILWWHLYTNGEEKRKA